MKKFIFILFVLLIAQKINAQQFIRSAYLSKPTFNSISIRMMLDTSTTVFVVYGKDSFALTDTSERVISTANQMLALEMKGLEAASTYFYKLACWGPKDNQTQYTPVYSFKTAKPAGQSFSFVVQADPHMDNQTDTAILFRSTLNQLQDKPDFLIDLGDFLMTDKLRNAAKIVTQDTLSYRCHLLSNFYEKSAHSLPVFIALGNHEGESGWNLNGNENNIAVWNTNLRNQFFPNPFPNTFYTGDTTSYSFVGKRAAYYAWHWGDALFVVLDPYWHTSTKPDSLNGWRWTLGKLQYDWLTRTLESSNATFKFVFAHQLIGGDPDGRGGVEFADLYEWGGKNLDLTEGFATHRPGWEMPIKELLKKYKVNVFFHGHDHFFAKQEKECLIYQETPQPGHPNFSNAGQAQGYGYVSGEILPNSGYLRVHVDSSQAKIEYVRNYKPSDETSNRKNKDVSNVYFINKRNCYDSVSTSTPVIWNQQYVDEMVYPNPFSTSTTIEFSLTIEQQVSLVIYNLKGQLVKELLTKNTLAPGRYRIDWDGIDAANRFVADANYVYQLKGSCGVLKSGQLIYKK